MFPQDFLQRINNQYYIDGKALLKALGEPSPVSVRINSAKWDKKPLNAETVPWCDTGYYLQSRPSFTLDPLFHAGCYYPQEASSMFLEQAIKNSAGSLENIRVLDLCGAPGGKSIHLSDLIGVNSLLVANEVIRSRAVVLAETVTKWGSCNTIVTQNDPKGFARLEGFFDIILIDAPCSGEGMFRDTVAIQEWSVDSAAHCSERQKRILVDVWPSLKENGILIYSTCTFNPGENEENIKWLIATKEAECIRMDFSELRGVTEIDLDGIYGYGLHPDKVMGEGFFISAIRKTGKQSKKTIKSHSKAENRPDKKDIAISEKWTSFPKERLLKWGNELFAVPCVMDDYIHLFQNLNVVKPGTKIFISKKNNNIPTHELALSRMVLKDAFPSRETSYYEAVAYLHRDSFTLKDVSTGWKILKWKGVNLGFVNNIGTRFNNYYPVEWRIRMNLPQEGFKNIIKWDSNETDLP